MFLDESKSSDADVYIQETQKDLSQGEQPKTISALHCILM